LRRFSTSQYSDDEFSAGSIPAVGARLEVACTRPATGDTHVVTNAPQVLPVGVVEGESLTARNLSVYVPPAPESGA
jgi:hypothetical protein